MSLPGAQNLMVAWIFAHYFTPEAHAPQNCASKCGVINTSRRKCSGFVFGRAKRKTQIRCCSFRSDLCHFLSPLIVTNGEARFGFLGSLQK